MINDRRITISIGGSRKSVNWQPAQMLLSEFYEKLRTPFRSSETIAEYFNMKKGQQDELKDAQGGYVAGTLNGPRRKTTNVTGRDVITLDFDTIPAGGTDDVLRRVEGLGVSYCVYSTRKHHGAAPRLRILIPFDRTVNADEYEPCARKMAEYIGLEMADPTTFEVARLMYWPSCSSDGVFVYACADKPFLSADGMLAQYADWRDVSQWPALPGTQAITKLAVKQSDPDTKTGVVGAFCRTYDVYRALDELIPGIYEPVDNTPGRYTYIGGSTTGGAVIYDNGKFLYSHHATDPCSGRLVNAFDLVRLHRFAELDDEAKDGTPINRLPSFTAMCRLADGLPEVHALLVAERGESALKDFEGIDEVENKDITEYMGGIADVVMTTAVVRQTLSNLGISVRLNIINHRSSITGSPSVWSVENSENNLPVYLRDFYIACDTKGAGKSDICDRLDVIADENRYNPVLEVLTSNRWDGKKRIDDIAKNILRSDDPFDAILLKKWMWQCVSVAINNDINPYGGEGALVLQGPQAAGKTSFFRELCLYPDLFTGGKLVDVRDKDSIIQSTENWICELGEMERMTKQDDKTLKALITESVDVYRTPYARKAVRRIRRASFCGTVNPDAFLVDDTGNRRYWTIKVGEIDHNALRKMPFSEKAQTWAEAYALFIFDPQGFRLTKTERETLETRNQSFSTSLPGELELLEHLDFSMPQDRWQWIRPAQITLRTSITPAQTGRALSKIARSEAGIGLTSTRDMHGMKWLVPLRFTVQSGSSA